MAARTIEARLVISGEDRASQAIANVVKTVRQLEDAAKVSKPLQEVAKSLLQVEQAEKAVNAAMSARSGFATAEAGLKATQGAALAAAQALKEARTARAAFDGVKAAKGSEQAQQIEAATKAVRAAGAEYRKVEGDVRRASAAVAAQTATLQYAETAAKALGADLGGLEAHQQRLRVAYDAGTAAITRQIAAEERAAKVGATMATSGRGPLAQIESGRRVADGMSAPGRATAAIQAKAAAEALQEVAAIRQIRVDAAKALASGAALYVGHKASQAEHAVAHTYAEFDDLIRYQTKVADLTPAERKSRMAQAVHLGGQTSFNDIQVLETQLTLAQRGVKKEFVEPFTQEIVNYAQAMNTTLPEAAKTLEGVVFSTNQNVESANGALTVMRKNVDMLVKTAKVGGLGDQDLKEAFKFGGASGTGAGLSPQTMGTIFATLHRVGFAGSEAGVATRAIAARLVSPTAKGRDALDAMGIDYNKFTTMPDAMSGKGLQSMSRRTFGKDMSQDQMDRIQAQIDSQNFTDDEGKEHSIIEDQGRFTAALAPILMEQFEKNKKGEHSVKDQKDVAKLIGRFYKMSVESVDSEGLLAAILKADPTMGQANALFTEKHGGKVTAMAKKLDVYQEINEAIRHVVEGFAKSIGDYRMEGFSGQMKRVKNTRLNMETAAGRALDDDGEGRGGILSSILRTVADAQQHIAELDPKVVAVGSAFAVVTGKVLEIGGTIGLMGSALALTKSAYALNAAAVRLGVGGAPAEVAKTVAPAAAAAFGLGGVMIAGGAVAGAYLDSSEATQGGMGAAAITGSETAGQRLIRENHEMLERQKTLSGQRDELAQRLDIERGVAGRLKEAYGSEKGNAAEAKQADAAARIAKWEDEIRGLDSKIRALGEMQIPPPRAPDFTDLKVKAGEAGTEAGTKAGEGIRSGIEAKAPEVEQQGRTLYERIKELFGQGINLPINFAPGEGMGGGGASGGLIQKASFGGGGVGGGSLGGVGSILRPPGEGAGGGSDSGSGAGSGSGRTVPRGAFGPGTGAGDSWYEATMRAEGTAGKDPYNVVLGNGRYGLPNKPLTDMSLAEAYRFGRTVRARHGSSSALGAFQIVGQTMKTFMGEAGLGWDDKFSPENQRKLADVIRRRQGFGAWEGFKAHRGELNNARRLQPLAPMVPVDEPRLVKGLDGKEGLDLGDGTMKMPDGSIRSIPSKAGLTIPDPPAGGFGGGGGRGRMDRAAERMHEAVDRMEGMGFHGQIQLAVTGSGRDQVRATGMRTRGRGGMSADLGISMPGAKESDGDWV